MGICVVAHMLCPLCHALIATVNKSAYIVCVTIVSRCELRQWPLKASASHQAPPSEAILASMTSGRRAGRGAATQAGPPSRSATRADGHARRRRSPGRSRRCRCPGSVTRAPDRSSRRHRSGAPRRRSRRRCRRRTTSGSSSRTAVSSSAIPIRNPPSPAPSTGSRSGPGQRGADRGGQAQPDRLEGLGEAEAELVRDRQVGAGVAHEVAGVDRDDPLARAGGRPARGSAPAGRCVRRRRGRRCDVAASGRVRRSAAAFSRGAVPRRVRLERPQLREDIRARSPRRRRARPGRRAGCAPSADVLDVDLHHARVAGPISGRAAWSTCSARSPSRPSGRRR